MAQTGAAREPTMEEILASIRRIIESNDGAEATPGARPQLESVAGGRAAEPAVAPAAASAAAEPVQKEPAVSTAHEPEHEEGTSPARAISLADVAARLRNSSGGTRLPPDREVEAEAEVEPVASFAETRIEPEVEPEAASDEAEVDSDVGIEPPAEPAEAVEPKQQTEATPDHDDAVRAQDHHDEPVAARASGSAPGAPATAQMSRNAPALISTEASAKVAAAFENLNEAVLKGQMRSFEDIAQDMLRPMLREWLDDNLPTLVERLVREEIERVARGGRR